MQLYGDEHLTDEEVEQIRKERYESELKKPPTVEAAKLAKERWKKTLELSIEKFKKEGREDLVDITKNKLDKILAQPLEDMIEK
ncbi:MAG: hypothetical protein Q4A55_07620 [Aerococcus sp.]|nr:hypothetical protein [Aerococcus sp.]